jgi:hypothetical protein
MRNGGETFYSAQLEQRVAALARLAAQRILDAETQGRVSCLSIERDKLVRLLGRDLRAGLSSALAWSHSDDQDLRMKAIFVLGDIAGEDAQRRLEELARDPNPSIASSSERYLDLLKVGRP